MTKRHGRPPAFEKFVFGTAFILAAILLFFMGQRALEKRAAAAPAGAASADDKVVPLPKLDAGIQRSGTREAVLNLPPLKVAGVGGGRRNSSEPPPPPSR